MVIEVVDPLSVVPEAVTTGGAVDSGRAAEPCRPA